MVQPAYPRDINHGLETLYYTLRGSVSPTRKPKNPPRTTTNGPQFPGQPPENSVPKTAHNAKPAGSKKEHSKHGSKPSQENDKEGCAREELNGWTRAQGELFSSSSKGPLRIVGPKLRVNPEAEDLLLGTSSSRCVGGATKEDSHEVGVSGDKGDQNALKNRRNRVRGSVIVVKGEWDGADIKMLEAIRLEKDMRRLGLL